MGTRALTTIKDSSKRTIVTLYRQSDGYQDAHGKELKGILSSLRLVNGLTLDDECVANGMGCLAAQLVAALKGKAGLHYIYPDGVANNWVDFHYTIYPTDDSDESTISIKVEEFGELLFDGLLSDYSASDLKPTE